MGLDMYLERTKRVQGLSFDDIDTIDNVVPQGEDVDYNSLDLEALSGIKGIRHVASPY